MMEGLRTWLFGVIAAAMVPAIIYGLLPKGAAGSIAKVTSGLILLLVLIRPVINIDFDRLELHYDGYADQIDTQIQQYRQTGQEQLAEIIEQKTAAYISKKAEENGVFCTVQVETKLRDGVPVPCSVVLSAQKHTALSQWMEQELGIAEAQQKWEVEQ